MAQAHEDMQDLMLEHITNSDRMNAFLSFLTQEGNKSAPGYKNQRKEMIKLYGTAAEIYEESLITFVQKIVLFLQKLLKQNEPHYHQAIAWSLGKIVQHVTSKI